MTLFIRHHYNYPAQRLAGSAPHLLRLSLSRSLFQRCTSAHSLIHSLLSGSRRTSEMRRLHEKAGEHRVDERTPVQQKNILFLISVSF